MRIGKSGCSSFPTVYWTEMEASLGAERRGFASLLGGTALPWFVRVKMDQDRFSPISNRHDNRTLACQSQDLGRIFPKRSYTDRFHAHPLENDIGMSLQLTPYRHSQMIKVNAYALTPGKLECGN